MKRIVQSGAETTAALIGTAFSAMLLVHDRDERWTVVA